MQRLPATVREPRYPDSEALGLPYFRDAYLNQYSTQNGIEVEVVKGGKKESPVTWQSN
jgi:hypothetical protein